MNPGPATLSGEAEEASLNADPRLAEGIARFNACEWYACHDAFEALWHETAGSMRPVLQGILQIAVGQLHLERGNRHGATVLTGEGLGRLRGGPDQAMGLDLVPLRTAAGIHLRALQDPQTLQSVQLPPLRLQKIPQTEAPQ